MVTWSVNRIFIHFYCAMVQFVAVALTIGSAGPAVLAHRGSDIDWP